MSEPTPVENPANESLSPRRMGLYILFGSMTMLFGAVLVGFFFTRAQNAVWITPEMPALPRGLWFSTLLLIGVSASFQSALTMARSNRTDALRRRLFLGTALVVAFLLAQVLNWRVIHAAELLSSVRTLYPSTFYLLTGVHALHVLGGLIPLGFVIHHAARRDYSSSRHEGLSMCVQYWHYLGLVWLVLFAALELGT